MKVCSFCSPRLTQNCVSESVRSKQPWVIPADLPLASFCSCWEHPQCTLSWCFQLHNQLGHTDVFRGFEEGAIAFDPTYKFDTGTDVYDTRWVGGVWVSGTVIRVLIWVCFTCCPSSKAGSTLSLPTTVSQPCLTEGHSTWPCHRNLVGGCCFVLRLGVEEKCFKTKDWMLTSCDVTLAMQEKGFLTSTCTKLLIHVCSNKPYKELFIAGIHYWPPAYTWILCTSTCSHYKNVCAFLTQGWISGNGSVVCYYHYYRYFWSNTAKQNIIYNYFTVDCLV